MVAKKVFKYVSLVILILFIVFILLSINDIINIYNTNWDFELSYLKEEFPIIPGEPLKIEVFGRIFNNYEQATNYYFDVIPVYDRYAIGMSGFSHLWILYINIALFVVSFITFCIPLFNEW